MHQGRSFSSSCSVPGAGLCAAAALLVGTSSLGAKQAEPTPAQVALHVLQQDIRVAELLRSLQEVAPHGLVVVRHVQTVDAVAETVTPGQSVIVQNDVISWVGDAAKEPQVSGATVVDGGSRYLAPGLVDMHVHSSSAGGWLLDLANGVTAVRDMGGFPWLLRFRESVSARRILAPALYVAGTIINAEPLGGYAVMPRNVLDARRIVRQQAACGYDFIKVHNILSQPMLDAIADEASKLGMDLVGHVPHGISVRHAVERGMRTMEHLKGFLNDETLKIGDTDYAAAVAAPEVWSTPTLYGGRSNIRGAEARAVLESAQARYVPLRKRIRWSRLADEPEDQLVRTRREAAGLMRQIIPRLLSVRAKFLAGTDADGYPFQVMGFALVDELQLLHEAGLSPAAAMRAATIEPARAMRVTDEFGAIRRGMRADLVILDENPLEKPLAFRSNRGVMVHGYWLDRKQLDDALDKLAATYAEPDESVEVSRRSSSKTYSSAKALVNAGFVFSAMELEALSAALHKAGLGDIADRFDALAEVPKSGPCAQFRPR